MKINQVKAIRVNVGPHIHCADAVESVEIKDSLVCNFKPLIFAWFHQKVL